MENKVIPHAIEIVTPAPPRSLHGNRMTAMRWALFLKKSKFAVQVAESWSGNSVDLLIALHALRSHQSIKLFKKAFSRRNIYDNFQILQNQKPQKEFVVVVTPDYVTITYRCGIWTNFVEQMDKLVEALNFASNSYWGDPSRFQFLAKIDSFDDIQTYEQGEDRLVRTEFNLTLNGYLIPDTLNAYLAQLQSRTYNLCKIVFNTEQTS